MIALLLSLVAPLVPVLGPFLSAWRFVSPLASWLWRAVLTFIATPSNLVIAALLVASAYGFGHFKGRWAERAVWEARIEEERQLQARVTAAQDAKALKDIQELTDEITIIQGQIEEYRAAAAADPNASRICLGGDSGLRINKGRKGKP